MEREENIESKIRGLRKQAGRRSGNVRGNPRRKRRRIDAENVNDGKVEVENRSEREKEECEKKRVRDDQISLGARKKQKMMTDFMPLRKDPLENEMCDRDYYIKEPIGCEECDRVANEGELGQTYLVPGSKDPSRSEDCDSPTDLSKEPIECEECD